MWRRLTVAAVLFVAAEAARDVSTLLAERVRCEEAAAGDADGYRSDADGCSPQQFVEVLVELGGAHLELGDREKATGAYEMAAQHSFMALGKESALHSKALVRLASHQLHGGEYQAANRLLSGWLRTYY